MFCYPHCCEQYCSALLHLIQICSRLLTIVNDVDSQHCPMLFLSTLNKRSPCCRLGFSGATTFTRTRTTSVEAESEGGGESGRYGFREGTNTAYFLYVSREMAAKIFIVLFERDSKTMYRSLSQNFYICLIW